MHPSSNPLFGTTMDEPVWYLAHPLAPDEKYTFAQNMNHVTHLMRIFYEEGVRVVAPYHTICLALDDDNPEWRRIGLEVDCCVVKLIGRIFLTGHKLSSGMENERNAALDCPTGGKVVNLVGLNDDQVRTYLRTFNETMRILKNGR